MMRDSFLPFCLPLLGQEEIDEVVDTLRCGWITTGPKTLAFEKQMAEYVGCRHALALSSCTAAMHLALAAAGVGAGDEVITSTLTFASTCNVAIHLGAVPRPVDIRRDTYNLDVERVAAAITPRTKAILAVHFAGHPADMEPLQRLAERHGLALIEDAAHAVGARYRGRMIGSIGRATCLSFYAIKNMTTGEGGMLLTDDEAWYRQAQRLALHGMDRDAWKRYTESGSWYYEVTEAGYKANMSDLQAAIGMHQARKLEGFIETRERYARRYDEAFASRPGFTVPFVATDVRHARHLYPLLIDPAIMPRADFIEHLRARNIGTTVNFIPIHRHPYYRDRFGLLAADFPNAEWYYERTVSLPLYPRMSEADVDSVIEAVLDVAKAHR